MDITSFPLGTRPAQPVETEPAASVGEERQPLSQNRASPPFSQVMRQAGETTNLSPGDTFSPVTGDASRRMERDLRVQNLQRLAQNMIRQSIHNVGTARMPMDTMSYAGELAAQTLAAGMMLPVPDHTPSRKKSEWESLRPVRGPASAEGSSLR